MNVDLGRHGAARSARDRRGDVPPQRAHRRRHARRRVRRGRRCGRREGRDRPASRVHELAEVVTGKARGRAERGPDHPVQVGRHRHPGHRARGRDLSIAPSSAASVRRCPIFRTSRRAEANMSTGTALSPLDYVKQFSADTGAAFQALRKAVLGSGPLDAHTCELIVLGALVTSGGRVELQDPRAPAAQGRRGGRSAAAGGVRDARRVDDARAGDRGAPLDRCGAERRQRLMTRGQHHEHVYIAESDPRHQPPTRRPRGVRIGAGIVRSSLRAFRCRESGTARTGLRRTLPARRSRPPAPAVFAARAVPEAEYLAAIRGAD